MGAYGYALTPLKTQNLAVGRSSAGPNFRSPVYPHAGARPSLERSLAGNDPVTLQMITMPMEMPKPQQIQFSGVTASSAIAQIDSRITDFTEVMRERVSKGKMPANSFADLAGMLSDLRDKAESHLVHGDFGAFAETSDSIESMMQKSEFLSEMYADRLKLRMMRQTIEEAHSFGIISAEEQQLLKDILAGTVRENASALMAGDENTFMVSLMELLQIAEATENIRQGLDNYKAQADPTNPSAMNRTVREEILPGMKSANKIDQSLLERNHLIVEFAARFLLSLRAAQAEILEGTRRQIEEINAAPKISGKQISALADTAQIIAETTKQGAITDHNEGAISDDMWGQIWGKLPKDALKEYRDTKAAIAREQAHIVALFAEIKPKTGLGETMPEAPAIRTFSSVQSSDKNEAKEMGQAITNSRPFMSNILILRRLYIFIEEQLEARRRAAQKHAEEIEDKKRAEEKRLQKKRKQKKHEMKLAERRRIEKQQFEKLTTVRTLLYFEELASRERSKAAGKAA